MALLGPPAPRVAAVKNFIWCSVENIEGTFREMFATIFPGNWRTKICEKNCQNRGRVNREVQTVN